MSTAVAFDPFEAGYVESPYAQYARLRTSDPVHWSDLLEGWVLTRYDDVARVLRDPTISVELDQARPTAAVESERTRMAERGSGKADTLVLRDDPDHARLRRLLQQPFGIRAIDDLREMIRGRVDDALDVLVGRGEMDVIADFAYPLPVAIFCEMLGIPEEDSPLFRDWTSAVARNLDPLISDDERAHCFQLLDEMERYLVDQIEEKRRNPADDIMTELVHAEEEGDRLTRDELVAQLVTLYVAGHEPTTALIGTGLLALLNFPEQREALDHDASRFPNAVNEFLRWDGPNQFVRRIATAPIEMSDRVVEAGQVIYCCVGAANRDPERWGADVDDVDIDRPDAGHHLQFGMGVHSCLGAHLARLQAELALRALVARLDHIALAGPAVWSERMVIRGLRTLPITFTAKR
ncbi:MAG TPA: cytochrome P450 [Acidimicrobiales bacterium]|nr:cytochrome P450 [Acidimicrobiales bacterium]